MSDSTTINSRLRVLIAKTFRAEKLYSSMKNGGFSEQTEHARLLELANNARAEVWQVSHAKLRKILNDILGQKSGSSVTDEVAKLRDEFQRASVIAQQDLVKAKANLEDTNNREEFTHSMRISLSLVRLKALCQANQIVADELTSILQSSRKASSDSNKGDSDFSYLSEENTASLDSESCYDNVLPFRRKASSGSGRGSF